MAKNKQFKLAGDQIKPLARGYGGCIASDKITVGGEPIAYMTREEPRHPQDSGWVFTSGTETQAYMDEASNFEVYDVNTIANYDRDIIPFLNAPAGSSFERRNNRGPLVPMAGTEVPPPAPGPNWPPPGFPLVEGTHSLTKSWSLALPAQFARRVEDGSLVLWRPGITLWLNAFNNDHGESQAKRVAAMKKVMSRNATDVLELTSAGLTRFRYRLLEDNVHTLTVLVFSDTGHLQAGIYFDEEADAATAIQIAESIQYSTAG